MKSVMTTVALLVVLFFLQLIVAGAIMAWLGRRLGGTRSTLARAGLIFLLLIVIGNALGFLAEVMPAGQPVGGLVLFLVVLLCQLYAAGVLFRRGLQLPKGRAWIAALGFLGLNVLAVALAFLVTWPYLLESFVVPFESMQPTIMAGDRITANKVRTPRRFDVVVYRSKESGGERYVKRVVGLPGETLTFQDGDLLINGKPAGLPPTMAGRLHSTVPNGPLRYMEGKPFQLGPDEFFVVGDNVDRSLDSRFEGPVARKDLVAVVELIYWPLNHMRIGF